ncbi:hypothetical protein [Limnobacter sp.]|uniref:hypothetical protein n=1 Tax=Limnobacter sp. TaxID=2003368 RepID=UPI00311DB468
MQAKVTGMCLLLLALSSNTLATDQVQTYLTSQLSKATIAYEDALERCEAQTPPQKKITLPVSQLSEAKVTLQELHSALSYFRHQTEQACLGNSRLALISAILDLNSYTSESPETLIDPVKSGLALLLPSPIQLETRAIYSQLSQSKANLLDSIFKGTSPTIATISNWQEAASTLRIAQTHSPMNKAN